MTTTDTHDYEAIETVLIEAARVLTNESELNVLCYDEASLCISMHPLRDGEVPRDSEYFWWGAGFHSGPYAPAEEWFGRHMVPTSEEWQSEGGDISMYCCSLGTGLDSHSTDPRAIARALERGYRDFCARRAVGDHHPDEYSFLND